MNSKLIAMVISLLTILSFTSLSAHSPDQSYLYLRIYESHVEGTHEMTYKDINTALGLNLKRGMKVDDIRPFLPVIHAYIKERVSLSANDQSYPMQFIEPEIMETKMGVFLRSHYELPSMKNTPEEVEIKYDVLFDRDEDHEGYLVIGHHWKSGIIKNEGKPSLNFSKGRTENTLNIKNASTWKGFYKMIKLGASHISNGLDHVLFLLALILPCFLRRKERADGTWAWEKVEDFKTAFWYVIKIVIWFAIAHSITLSMTMLGVIDLSPGIVESIIAISIAFAAFHNIRPIHGDRIWLIALGFGLFHGVGFANYLGSRGLNGEYITESLLGYNLGIEIGQVFVIGLIFLALYILRNRSIYRSILLYGSMLLIAISVYWFIERFFDVNFILDDYIEKAFRKIKRLM